MKYEYKTMAYRTAKEIETASRMGIKGWKPSRLGLPLSSLKGKLRVQRWQ